MTRRTRDDQYQAAGRMRARLLDLVPGRSATAYSGWLKARTEEFWAGAKHAAPDPFRGYANACATTCPRRCRCWTRSTWSSSAPRVSKAIAPGLRLVTAGARFIATNPDATGPSQHGPLPATGAVAALITRATGVQPYFVGKRHPMASRSALNQISAHSETTVMIGERMDSIADVIELV